MSLPNRTPNRLSLGLRKSVSTKTPYKSASSLTTPTTTPTNNKSPSKCVTQSAPTNFTPYRLSLNKRLRDTMTKKRLEFHMAQEKEKAQTSLSQDIAAMTVNDSCVDMPTTPITSTTDENGSTQKRRKLIQQIEIVEEEMQARQRHISKTEELQGEIEKWRHGFHHALDDFQNNILPYRTKLALARGLGIDANLLAADHDDSE